MSRKVSTLTPYQRKKIMVRWIFLRALLELARPGSARWQMRIRSLHLVLIGGRQILEPIDALVDVGQRQQVEQDVERRQHPGEEAVADEVAARRRDIHAGVAADVVGAADRIEQRDLGKEKRERRQHAEREHNAADDIFRSLGGAVPARHPAHKGRAHARLFHPVRSMRSPSMDRRLSLKTAQTWFQGAIFGATVGDICAMNILTASSAPYWSRSWCAPSANRTNRFGSLASENSRSPNAIGTTRSRAPCSTRSGAVTLPIRDVGTELILHQAAAPAGTNRPARRCRPPR